MLGLIDLRVRRSNYWCPRCGQIPLYCSPAYEQEPQTMKIGDRTVGAQGSLRPPFTMDENGLVTGQEHDPKTGQWKGVSYDIYDAREWPGDHDDALALGQLIAVAPKLLAFVKRCSENKDGCVSEQIEQAADELVAEAGAYGDLAPGQSL